MRLLWTHCRLAPPRTLQSPPIAAALENDAVHKLSDTSKIVVCIRAAENAKAQTTPYGIAREKERRPKCSYLRFGLREPN